MLDIIDMDSTKLLSGRELVENQSLKVSDSIPTKGVKDVLPNGSWMERKQIENTLDAHKSLLNQQRIEKRGSLSQAEWLHDLDKALVTEPKGPHWLHIGHVEDKKTYIYPEEALYLMEMNCLELKYGRVLMSLQQAYTLLIGKSVLPDEYRVYSLLSKQGYKVLRYNKNRKYYLSDCEIDSNVNDDKSSELLNTKQNKVKQTDDTERITEDVTKSLLDNLSTVENVDDVAETSSKNFDKKTCDISLAKSGNYTNVTPGSNCISNLQKETVPNCVVDKSSSFDTDVIQLDTDTNNSESLLLDCQKIVANELNNDPPQKLINVEMPSSSINAGNKSNITDVIDLDSYNNSLENKSIDINVISTISTPVPMEITDKVLVVNNDSISMRVDSSSDDCLIVDESLKTKSNSPKSARKRTSNDENMANSSSKYIKSHQERIEVGRNENQETEVIDMDEVSIASKLKILQSITNCYNKDVVHVKVPNKDFIPADINLTKSSYCVNIGKFFSKKDIQSNNSNFQSHGYNRVNPNCARNNANQMSMPILHNHQYWNHIFHQLRLQSQSSHFVRRLAGFGGGLNTWNVARDPRLNRHFTATIPAPFLLQRHSGFNHRNVSYENRSNLVSQNVQSPFFYNDNIRNHVNNANMIKQNQENCLNKRIDRMHTADTRNFITSECNEIQEDDEGISQPDALDKLKELLAVHNSLSEHEKSVELTETLKQAIVVYNAKFEEKFLVNFDDTLKLFTVVRNQREKNVQLDSDSDTLNRYDRLTANDFNKITRNRQVKKKTRHELNQRRRNISKLCFDVNDSDSTDESVCFSSEEIPPKSDKIITVASTSFRGPNTSRIIPSNCENVQPNDLSFNRLVEGGFESWSLNSNSWNKPEISAKRLQSKRYAFTNINLSTAYLFNIKELSYNANSSVNSWRQAKQLYEYERTSNTVCVSDEDILEDSDSNSNDGMMIMTDKTVPLVRPQDCKSVETVLNRLQIIKSTGDISGTNDAEELPELKISFDVYSPTFRTLKKSRLPPPNHSIVVLSHSSPLPTPAQLSRLRSSLQSRVPFLFAVISFDAVSFIQMENVDLPKLVSNKSASNIHF